MRSIADLKTSILQSVAECDDEKILNQIDAFILELKTANNVIVGYSSSGRPLTLKEYQASIEEARAEYRANKIITQEEMEREED